jgi:hypothetical protein
MPVCTNCRRDWSTRSMTWWMDSFDDGLMVTSFFGCELPFMDRPLRRCVWRGSSLESDDYAAVKLA